MVENTSIREIIEISEEESKPIEDKAVILLRQWNTGAIRSSEKFFTELFDEAKKVHTPAAYFAAGMYAEMLNQQVIQEQKQKDQFGEMFLKPKGKWHK